MAFAPDINTEIRQSFVATTSATATDLIQVPLPTGTVFSIAGFVSSSRTGGASGSAGDSAGYRFFATFKNVSGTVSQVGSTEKQANEDQAGWDVSFLITGTIVSLQVTGAASNNVTWAGYFEIIKMTP